MKNKWQLLIGLAISAVALVLALWRIDLAAVAETLTQANYFFLIPAAFEVVLYMLARAIRWRLLLGPQVSLGRYFWVTNIGYLVSNVLPFRLGDPARAVVIARGEDVSTAAAVSTVVVERVLDMMMVVLLLAGVAPFLSGIGNTLWAGLAGGAAVVVAAAALLFFAFRPDAGKRLVRWGLRLLPRLDVERWAHVFDGLFDGLTPLRSGRRGLALLGWSVVIWGLVVFYYWALIRAFLPQPPLLASPFLVCVLGLGMAVPSSPGAMGVFHAIARYALTIPFGVPVDQAVTIAFAAHAFQYVLGCLLGLAGLARESLSLSWLQSQAASVEERK